MQIFILDIFKENEVKYLLFFLNFLNEDFSSESENLEVTIKVNQQQTLEEASESVESDQMLT